MPVPHTIITHIDSAGYCTGIAAFDIVRGVDGLYDTQISHGDRGMCGFHVDRTESRRLTSDKLGTLVGDHASYAIFACGAAVTRDWVARTAALLNRLGDPTLSSAYAAAVKLAR